MYDEDATLAAFIPRRVLRLASKIAVEIGLPLRTPFLTLQLPGPHTHIERKHDSEDDHHYQNDLRETHPRSVTGHWLSGCSPPTGIRTPAASPGFPTSALLEMRALQSHSQRRGSVF